MYVSCKCSDTTILVDGNTHYNSKLPLRYGIIPPENHSSTQGVSSGLEIMSLLFLLHISSKHGIWHGVHAQ